MALSHDHLIKHLSERGIANTVSGQDASLTGTLKEPAILELIRACSVTGYQLNIVAGTPKLQLRG